MNFRQLSFLINLTNLKEKTEKRQLLANIYNNKIKIKCKKPNLNKGHMVAQYSILIDNRSKFIEYLKKNNIAFKIFYHKSMIDQTKLLPKPFSKRFKLLITDKITKSIISLPCYDTLDIKEVNRIIDVINKFISC